MRNILFIFIFFFILTDLSLANIYVFKDNKGVLHFTNVPTNSEYKLYIKSGKSKIYKRYSKSQFDTIIRKASREFGLEPELIKAVITAESNFNHRAVSSKGAKGLMQIMPSNYKELGILDPFNPSENIMGGSKYLRKLLQIHKGKLKLALASYNAGPNAVKRYKGIPPYKETKNYVAKVIKIYKSYKN